MNKRLEEICKKNAELEKESPYNFCDRWCERCVHEKQIRDEDDLDEEDMIDFEDLPEDIQKHIKFVENNPLPATAEQYRKRAHNFLKSTFYKDEKKYAALNYDFQTVAWYHTLLSAKLQRALAGFHEPACDGDFALYDAIAQLEICKKAINLSVEALRKIHNDLVTFHQQILELIALLHNIYSRIEAVEENI